jgi:hypothetical protein
MTSGMFTDVGRPRWLNRAAVVLMSRSPGTLRSRLLPSESKVAHKMGRAAFFAPPTRIVPESFLLPRILMASMLVLAQLRCLLASRKVGHLRQNAVFDPVLFANQLVSRAWLQF